MLTLYAHKLFTKPTGAKHQTFGVAITRTPELPEFYQSDDNTVCIYDWWRESRPDKRNKTIMHNCARYNLVWSN